MKYVKVENQLVKVSVVGVFEVNKAFEIKNEVFTVIMERNCSQVEVDFKSCTYMDSSAINELIKLRQKVRAENFWVINPSEKIYKTLKAHRLTDWIKS
jgi:anti-anti-sigma factor